MSRRTINHRGSPNQGSPRRHQAKKGSRKRGRGSAAAAPAAPPPAQSVLPPRARNQRHASLNEDHMAGQTSDASEPGSSPAKKQRQHAASCCTKPVRGILGGLAVLMSTLVWNLFTSAHTDLEQGNRSLLNVGCFFGGMGTEVKAFTDTKLARVTQYVDICKAACKVVHHHFPHLNPVPQDINDPDLRINDDLDIATCTWPCTDSSPMGNLEGIIDGECSSLVWRFLDLVEAKVKAGKPVPILLFENVPYILNNLRNGGVALQHLINRLNKIGYQSTAYRTMSAGGVRGEPSDRERVIIVSFWQGDASCVLLSEGVDACDGSLNCQCHDQTCGLKKTNKKTNKGSKTTPTAPTPTPSSVPETILMDQVNAWTEPCARDTLPTTTTSNPDGFWVLERAYREAPDQPLQPAKLYKLPLEEVLRINGFPGDYLDVEGVSNHSKRVLLGNAAPLTVMCYVAYLLVLATLTKRGTKDVRVHMPQELKRPTTEATQRGLEKAAGGTGGYVTAGYVNDGVEVGLPCCSVAPLCADMTALASFVIKKDVPVNPEKLSHYLMRVALLHGKEVAAWLLDQLQTVEGLVLEQWVVQALDDTNTHSHVSLPGQLCWLMRGGLGPAVAVVQLACVQVQASITVDPEDEDRVNLKVVLDRTERGQVRQSWIRQFHHLYSTDTSTIEVVDTCDLLAFTALNETDIMHCVAAETLDVMEQQQEQSRVAVAKQAYEAQNSGVLSTLKELTTQLHIRDLFAYFCNSVFGPPTQPRGANFCGMCSVCQSKPSSTLRCLAYRAWEALGNGIIPGCLLTALGRHCIGVRLRLNCKDGRQYHATVHGFNPLTLAHTLVLEDGESMINALWEVNQQDFQVLSFPHQWHWECTLMDQLMPPQSLQPLDKSDQQGLRANRDGRVRDYMCIRNPPIYLTSRTLSNAIIQDPVGSDKLVLDQLLLEVPRVQPNLMSLLPLKARARAQDTLSRHHAQMSDEEVVALFKRMKAQLALRRISEVTFTKVVEDTGQQEAAPAEESEPED